MKNNNHIIFRKLQNLKQRNTLLIFLLDITLSTLGTLLASAVLWTISDLEWQDNISVFLLISAVFSAIFLRLFGVYTRILDRYQVRDWLKLVYATACTTICLFLISIYYVSIIKWGTAEIIYGAFLDFTITVILLVSTRMILIVMYYYVVSKKNLDNKVCLLYGTDVVASTLIEQINSDFNLPYYVRGLLSKDVSKEGAIIAGRPVFYRVENSDQMLYFLQKQKIKSIIFTSEASFISEKNDLVDICILNNIQVILLQDFDLTKGKEILSENNLKPIVVNDLFDHDNYFNYYDVKKEVEDKVILITGAAGIIGKGIVKRLSTLPIKQLILIDNSETELHSIQIELEQNHSHINAVCKLSDIQIENNVDIILNKYRPDMIFHAAAYTHVFMLEENPCAAVLTNVGTTINMANCAIKYGVKRFIQISTNKASNPTNIMGATKRIAEVYLQNIKNNTQFTTIRFGSLLDQNSSLITSFEKRILSKDPIILTHLEMSRSFMSPSKACRLILETLTLEHHGGEIFTFNMGRQMNVADLAKKMIHLSGLQPYRDIKILYSGLRSGETTYEEVPTEENSISTKYLQIRITNPKQYNETELQQNIELLMTLAQKMDEKETVLQMKKIIPEFISVNSKYEKYDAKN